MQLAQLPGTFLKAVQSFKQGCRDIPVSAERQVPFLMALKSSRNKKARPCWVIRRCPKKSDNSAQRRSFRQDTCAGSLTGRSVRVTTLFCPDRFGSA